MSADVTPLLTRSLRSHSLLTAMRILGTNIGDILGGKKLEYNTMTGRPELGREALKDSHITMLRSEIEQHFTVAIDKKGNEIGLQISKADLFDAATAIAEQHSYHPVQDYLSGLKWDGTERIDHVADEILGAERSSLNIALIRNFFISAVARAMRPGCKVDTVLVLVGGQGIGKSTFIRKLGNPWVIDSALDIHNKDSFQVARSAWIVEFAELEALRRARDANAIKSFLSSPIDSYRPSYGRLTVDVPRTFIVVGTTNSEEFLTDETGARRFWPLTVNAIDIKLLEFQRDQLWAEAVDAYRKEKPWWLNQEEEKQLATAHKEHRVRDAWEPTVLSWAEGNAPFTTADVLGQCIEKPTGQWTRADEMRVSSILKTNGWKRVTSSLNRNVKIWKRYENEQLQLDVQHKVEHGQPASDNLST